MGHVGSRKGVGTRRRYICLGGSLNDREVEIWAMANVDITGRMRNDDLFLDGMKYNDGGQRLYVTVNYLNHDTTKMIHGL